ncbi:MAG: hypothetical protein ACO3QP_01180 [Burkholderiaceae bacterium]
MLAPNTLVPDTVLTIFTENFGDLSAQERASFLVDVCAQMRTDLDALRATEREVRAAALHRIAGSAASLGCEQFGQLARAAMQDPSGSLDDTRRAGAQALAWLDALLNLETPACEESRS